MTIALNVMKQNVFHTNVLMVIIRLQMVAKLANQMNMKTVLNAPSSHVNYVLKTTRYAMGAVFYALV